MESRFARDEDGIRAEAFHHVGDGAIEAGEDGADADDGAGADDYAEHGKHAAELVRANGIEREQHVVLKGEKEIHELNPPAGRRLGLAGCLTRRINAEKQPYACGEAHAQRYGDERHFHRQRRGIAHNTVAQKRDRHADKAADHGKHGGFDKELIQDILAARAERFANADFAGSFRDDGQHDVHDDDAADHQEHRNHGEGHAGDGAGQILPGIGKRIGTKNAESVFVLGRQMAVGAQ